MFYHGFKDKEIDLKNTSNWLNLRETFKALTPKETTHRLSQFETDCCVCFNSFANEVNPVVYCSK